MAVAPCSDLSPADWLGESELAWSDLVGFGPSGFAAYAQLRFVPDPAFEGESEGDGYVRAGEPSITDQWRALFEVLAGSTSTPEDCYFCLWDGWPNLPDTVLQQPKLGVPRGERYPARAYFLFRGALPAVPDWGGPQLWQGGAQFWPAPIPHYEPAFVWPADHAWCVANDVDPHWAGIGADAPVIDRLLGDPRLDAISVSAAPRRSDPTHSPA